MAQEKTLIYSDHEPLGGMRTRFIKDVFFSAIEKESNGRLKIQAHWDGKLATGYDALRKVADGVAVVPEYALDLLPLHQIFKSFLVGPSGDGLSAADREAVGRAAETAYKTLSSMMNESFDAQLADLRKEGANIRILESEEMERWKTATDYRAVQSAWVKAQEDKGVKDAGAVMQARHEHGHSKVSILSENRLSDLKKLTNSCSWLIPE